MERYLIVDSKRAWIDFTDVQPDDQIVAQSPMVDYDYPVVNKDGLWYLKEREKFQTLDFHSLYTYYRQHHWKFFVLRGDEPRKEPGLCPVCNAFTVWKEGDICAACAGKDLPFG